MGVLAYSLGMNTRSLFVALMLAAPIAAPLFVPGPALAADGDAKTNDDDPTINGQGMGINKILRVLQTNPDSASDSCINALKEMRNAQSALSKQEQTDPEHNEDIGVARDILSSDMEDVSTICGADARTYCRKAQNNPKLAASCNALPDDGDE